MRISGQLQRDSDRCAGGMGSPCRFPQNKRCGWLPTSFWVGTGLSSVAAKTRANWGFRWFKDSRVRGCNHLQCFLALNLIQQACVEYSPSILLDSENSENRTISSSSPYGQCLNWWVYTTSAKSKRHLMFSFSRAALFQISKHLGGFLKHWSPLVDLCASPGCVREGTPEWRPQFSLHCLTEEGTKVTRPWINYKGIFTIGYFSWGEGWGVVGLLLQFYRALSTSSSKSPDRTPCWAVGKKESEKRRKGRPNNPYAGEPVGFRTQLASRRGLCS